MDNLIWWLVAGVMLFYGTLEALHKYVNTPLKPRPSQLDRFFISDENWVGMPML